MAVSNKIELDLQLLNESDNKCPIECYTFYCHITFQGRNFQYL